MAKALEGKLTIIGLDRDPQAIERAQEVLKGKAEKIILLNEDFRNLDKVLAKHAIAKADCSSLTSGFHRTNWRRAAADFPFKKMNRSS